MKTKMTWSGIGPKIGLLSLPYLLLCIVIIYRDKELLSLGFLNNTFTSIAGWCLLSTGVLFLVFTVVTFLKGFNNGKLVTNGTYGLCRNPIYASWILFIIPGFAFIFQSGLILTVSIVLYLNFKIAIHGEYILLHKNFGDEYDKYEAEVNEILPIPNFIRKRHTS